MSAQEQKIQKAILDLDKENGAHALKYVQNVSFSEWGKCPGSPDRTKTFKWIHAALKACEAGHKDRTLFVAAMKKLIGNARLFNYAYENGEPGYKGIMDLSAARLAVLAEAAESQFRKLGLGEKLGSLGIPKRIHIFKFFDGIFSSVGNPGQIRQDDCGAPCPNWQWSREWPLKDDQTYCWALTILGSMVNDYATNHVKQTIAPFGGLCANPGVKKFARMETKFIREGADHWKERSPMTACNLDVVRFAAIFKDCDGMTKAFNALAQSEEFKLVRVKNNYRPNFNAAKESAGYRAILANYVYTPQKTWGELKKPNSGLMFEEQVKGCVDPNNHQWHTSLQKSATDYVNSAAVQQKPVSFVIEVQFMHQVYAEMRKKSHMYYKIMRSSNNIDLCMDFRL